MDDFVRNKLTEWKLSEWIETFEAQEIDEESLYHLDDQEINLLITKAGPRVKFKDDLKLLKLQWRPACRYDMSNPQNLQQAHPLGHMMADMAALQQQQAAVQAQAEQQTRLLQNLLAAANPIHLDRLGLSPEDHRRRFRGCRMGAQDQPFSFAQRLRYAAERWLQPGPTKGEVRLLEAIVLEQFVEGLPVGTADWVKRRKPPSLEVAVALAEDHLMARTENPGRSLPGEVLAATDTVPGSPVAAPGQECWRCGQLGHFQQECPLMEVQVYHVAGMPTCSDGPGRMYSIPELKNTKQPQKEAVNTSSQLYRLCKQEHKGTADLDQDLPCVSAKGKRKSDLLLSASSQWQPPPKQQYNCAERSQSVDHTVNFHVKDIMRHVSERLHGHDKLSVFLKDKIKDLETEKRHLVGVFGKTGAGKSSLINAIINKKGLLPSGSVSACTSVMIKVEATNGSKYEAHIEFITKEAWKSEVDSLKQAFEDNDNDDDDGGNDHVFDPDGKLSALYGDEWKEKSALSLMDNKYFIDIPEFRTSKIKILKSDSAEGLSEEFVRYTRSESNESEEVKRWYWPLVKCVTVKVPDNDFLDHVTLVDLPRNGDCNGSRDQMWKEFVASCSTVWIVTEMNRAASEKEAWEILEDASSLLGNGGECQQIHFICTKSEHEKPDDLNKVKNAVMKEFKKRKMITNYFSEDCFKVFTVSSTEFLKGENVNPDLNEIPKLKDILKNLNDAHSETSNYVSGAYGILSLIQRAKSREVVEHKNDVCAVLEGNLSIQLNRVKKAIEDIIKAFEQHLREGVEKSQNICEKNLKSFLYKITDRSFHRILRFAVRNDGIQKPKKGKRRNLNMILASCLTESIDEVFRRTFPNDIKCGNFNGAIDAFSLSTDSLIEKYKDVELQLTFLKTEEKKMKAKVNKTIRTQKKLIYNSLTETIKDNMKECYKEAAAFEGPGTLKNMRDTIERHVHSKMDMFEEAKNVMLEQLNNLKETVLRTLEKTMKESIEHSLKPEACSLPDVSEHLKVMKEHYDELSWQSR